MNLPTNIVEVQSIDLVFLFYLIQAGLTSIEVQYNVWQWEEEIDVLNTENL